MRDSDTDLRQTRRKGCPPPPAMIPRNLDAREKLLMLQTSDESNQSVVDRMVVDDICRFGIHDGVDGVDGGSWREGSRRIHSGVDGESWIARRKGRIEVGNPPRCDCRKIHSKIS